MFTGIITDLGNILSMNPEGSSIQFIIEPFKKKFLRGVNTGDSISVNGACMTVERKSKDTFGFTAIKESLGKTNLGLLKAGVIINLEKAVKINSRLDGHIVQGHVDTTGIIKRISKINNSSEFFIQFPGKFRDNIIYTGSITINGVSLTVAEIVKESSLKVMIKVAIIPYTFEATNFSRLMEEDIVNLEFDMLGKYVQRIFMKKI